MHGTGERMGPDTQVRLRRAGGRSPELTADAAQAVQSARARVARRHRATRVPPSPRRAIDCAPPTSAPPSA